MSHHLLVAAVLLTACILVVDVSGSNKGKRPLIDEITPVASGSGSRTRLSKEMRHIIKVVEEELLPTDPNYPSATSPITDDGVYQAFKADVDLIITSFEALLQENVQYELDSSVQKTHNTLREIRERYRANEHLKASSPPPETEAEIQDVWRGQTDVWHLLKTFESNNPQVKKDQRVQNSLNILKIMKKKK